MYYAEFFKEFRAQGASVPTSGTNWDMAGQILCAKYQLYFSTDHDGYQ